MPENNALLKQESTTLKMTDKVLKLETIVVSEDRVCETLCSLNVATCVVYKSCSTIH